MDEYRENVKKVQKALNQDAAFIQPNPYLAQRVLNAANAESYGKGGIVVKRKMPIALIIAAVLMLSGIVAVAATLLWQDYVPQMTQTEHEMGDYVEWPATRRIQLAKDIVVMGYLDESEDTLILSSETATEPDKAAAADRLMLKLTGLEDVKEIHSTLITYAIMGHEDTWTPEQRVWWNGIETMYGDDGATDTLIVPTEDVLSEEDAIAIASAALQEAYGFDDAYMDSLTPVADMYVTDENPDYKRWHISFKKYREGSSSYEEKVYPVVVDENGEVIEDLEIGVLHVTERALNTETQREEKPDYIQRYIWYQDNQGGGMPFWYWPYEVKAVYSAEMIPLTANLESLNMEIAETLRYCYGLPASDDVAHADALSIAYEFIETNYGLSSDRAKRYCEVYEAFDITDANKSIWKFVLVNPDDFHGMRYRVHIDSKTGDVIFSEEFLWQERLQDEEYDLKFF